jgi:hypothetical protein
MKNLILDLITISLLAFSLSAHAEEPPTALQTAMKKMNANLKTISLQVNDPSKNQNSIELTKDFVLAVKAAKLETPKLVHNMPVVQQDAAMAHYNERLDRVVAVGEKLIENLVRGDNAAANDNLKQLKDAKRDGHAEFTEQN